MARNNFDGREESKWELGPESFLTRKEVQSLRSWLLARRKALDDNRKSWLEWFVVELGMNTGLRVAEMADLRCGDIRLRDELSTVFVRNGKGGKSRQVRINREFQVSAGEFLKWKKRMNEPTGKNSIVFLSHKTGRKYSTRGLQLAFKRCLEYADIPDYHSIHHLRHTYASLLYSSSNYNLRFVQKQLGHSSPVITQVYANVFGSEAEQAIEGLLSHSK